MVTINAPSGELDASARGRLDAWGMLTNLALDRPIVGGGFEPYTREDLGSLLPGAVRRPPLLSPQHLLLGSG